MLGFTKSCSNTWSSKGINVNCICPVSNRFNLLLGLTLTQGYVATDFNPELRGQDPISQQILSRIPYGAWAKPFDMAGAAVYLASPASDYVCGQALVVDGGVRL
jgi:2-deoxy-D-gluconate 3-dehydrogenase